MNALNLDNLLSTLHRGEGGWLPLFSTLVALVALMLLWATVRRQWRAARARDYDASHDAFAQAPPMNEEQVKLLHYLQSAFPDGAVLFRPSLARFLAVRRTRNRLGVQQRLVERHVDFLICADDGKPFCAFEVDAFKQAGDAEIARLAAEKNRMLKSAGIRLIRLKGVIARWPAPEVLRERLMAVQRPAVGDSRATSEAGSGFAPSSFGHTEFRPSRTLRDSDTMGLSTLMGVPGKEDPWSAVRKR